MNKLSKKILQLVFGLAALWYGATTMQGGAFNWLGWFAAMLGGISALFAAEDMIDMTDRYRRWR